MKGETGGEVKRQGRIAAWQDAGAGLAKHRLVRQALAIGGWQMGARVITFGGSVWAARCLGPEKLGISAMILAAIAQVNVFTTLNQDTLYVRRFKHSTSPREREEMTAIVLSFRTLLALALLLIALPVLAVLRLEWQWMLGVAAAFPLLFFTATFPTWLLMAEENMPANSRALALQSAVTGILYLAVFRRGQAAGSDVLVMAGAMFIAWTYAWRMAIGRAWPLPFQAAAARKAWPLLMEGRWLALTGLVYLYGFFEMPLLGYLSGLKEAGKYRTAYMLANVIGQLLAILPTLLYPRFIEWHKAGPGILWRRQLKLTGAGLLTFSFASFACFLLAPRFYHFFFGARFEDAAYPFVILVVSKFLIVLNGIFAWGLWAQGKDKMLLGLIIPTACIFFALSFAFVPRYGMWASATMNVVCESIILAGTLFLSWREQSRAVTS